MSPSQAMNNRSPPSVRRHPPGLVCSLLASVPCHGLAPTVCLPSTFFLDVARRRFVSVGLYLFASPSLPHPTSVSFCALLPPLLFPLVLLTQAPQSNEQADYVREERQQKGECFATRGIKREVIYLPLFLAS